MKQGVSSIVPVDTRLSKEESKELNDKEDILTIKMQERLLELEEQRANVLAGKNRDSCNLYENYDKFIREIDE